MFAAQRLCPLGCFVLCVAKSPAKGISIHERAVLSVCLALSSQSEWGLTILNITVHLVDVSAIDLGATVDMALIAGRYALRASNGDLPIASRRKAAGVGLLLRDALGVSTTPSLRVLLSARSSLRMGRHPLFPFHMAEAWPSSLFPMLLGRSEDLLAWISRRSMRLLPLRLSVW